MNWNSNSLESGRKPTAPIFDLLCQNLSQSLAYAVLALMQSDASSAQVPVYIKLGIGTEDGCNSSNPEDVNCDTEYDSTVEHIMTELFCVMF